MTTVGTLLTRVARDLHQKDNTFKLGLEAPYWSPDEMIGYVNYVERDFLRRAGIKMWDVSKTLPAGSPILFAKPNGTMDIERVSFNKVRIRRQSVWDLARENPSWRNNPPGRPHYWHEDHLAVADIEVDRLPAAGGTLRFFVTMVPIVHAPYPGGYAEDISVIDCWEPYIRWDVLSLALSKDGDYQDSKRGQYCHQRYMLGVSLARRLVQGPGAQAGQIPQQQAG